MKKENIYKIFYSISLILAIACIVFVIIDYINYNSMITSAPFYVNILIRGIEFILPSILCFVIGKIIQHKNK